MPATNETFVPKTYDAAQGAALFRALSHDQQAALRHFEVTVLEKVVGARHTKQPKSWNYAAVTDTALLLVALSGKSRSMVAIPLETITDMVENEDSVGTFNEEVVGDAAKRFFVVHRPGPGASSHPLSDEGPTSTSGAAAARWPTDAKRVSRGRMKRSVSEASASQPDSARGNVAANTSSKSLQLQEEMLSIITMESPSLLFFHLWQAWMQVHTHRSLERSLSSLPVQVPNQADSAPSSPARRRCDDYQHTLQVQRQLTEACVQVPGGEEVPCYMTEYSMREASMEVRRALFAAEAVWATVVHRARAASFLASFVGLHQDRASSARALLRASSGSSRKQLQDQLQQPVGRRAARRSFVRSRSFQQGFSALISHRRGSEAAVFMDPELVQLSMLRKMAQGRMSPRAVGDLEREDHHQTAGTLNWEHMALGLLCIHARTRAAAILEWLGGMLDNSSVVRARLQIFRYEGTQYSVQELISMMFALNIPEEPPELQGAPTRRRSIFVQSSERSMSHGFMDVLVGILYNLDSIAEQAGAEGILSDRYYVWTHLSKVSESDLRPKVCAMFVRLVDLMIECPKGMNTALVYRLAHVMYIIILAIPSVAGYINEEYDEEVRYVLQNPELELGKSRKTDFFISKAIPLVQEVVATCVAYADKPI